MWEFWRFVGIFTRFSKTILSGFHVTISSYIFRMCTFLVGLRICLFLTRDDLMPI